MILSGRPINEVCSQSIQPPGKVPQWPLDAMVAAACPYRQALSRLQ